jgi:hypothetical protein
VRDLRGRCVGVLCEIGEGEFVVRDQRERGVLQLLLCEREGEEGVCVCVCCVRSVRFWKMVDENLGVNHFLKICTVFSD